MNLSEFCRAIPKVELHVHLLGAIRLETLGEMAQRQGAGFTAEEVAELARRDAKPKGVGGFQVRGLAVGNGLPAYPAANLAWQRGAKDIVIAGLTKADQEALAPFFTLKMPAGVKIAFA